MERIVLGTPRRDVTLGFLRLIAAFFGGVRGRRALRLEVMSEELRRDIGLADGRPTVSRAKRAAGGERRC